MARILIATRSDINGRGGSAFHLRNMKEVLEADGHSIEIWKPKKGTYDEPTDNLRDALDFFWKETPNAIIADYSWMCNVFNYYVDERIKKICFVHDLRCRIIPCLKEMGYVDHQNWTEEKEAALLQKADTLLVLNEDDLSVCHRLAPNAKTIRIGIAMEPRPRDAAKEIPGRCIYVGSPVLENRYAIEWFKREVWPFVLQQVPSATLDVCMGNVGDLEEHYAQAQLMVAPHRMRGGLKIRVAEAFSRGLPVVGNVCAFDGFDLGEFEPSSDNPSEMAEMIIMMLKLDGVRNDWSARSRSVCLSKMTPQAAYGELLKELT